MGNKTPRLGPGNNGLNNLGCRTLRISGRKYFVNMFSRSTKGFVSYGDTEI